MFPDERNEIVLDSYFGDAKNAVLIVNNNYKLIYKNESCSKIGFEIKNQSLLDILKNCLQSEVLVKVYESVMIKQKINLTDGFIDKKIESIRISPIDNEGFIIKISFNEFISESASRIFQDFPGLPLAYLCFNLGGNSIIPAYASENFQVLFPMINCDKVFENDKYFFEKMHPQDMDSFKKKITKLKNEENIFRSEFRMINDDKSERWYRVTAGNLGKEGDDLLIAYFEDINEIKFSEINREEIIQTNLENERTRISSELHDSIGQNLTAINLTLAQLNISDPNSSHLVTLIRETLKESILQVKSVCYYLTPPSLDLGLLHGLDTFFGRQNEMSPQITYTFSSKKINLDHINQVDSYNLFRVIQEFVSNSQKHSKCKTIDCTIKTVNGNVVIQICDDGVGFDPEKIKPGFGLKNIENRLKLFKCEYFLESEIGVGTNLKICI